MYTTTVLPVSDEVLANLDLKKNNGVSSKSKITMKNLDNCFGVNITKD